MERGSKDIFSDLHSREDLFYCHPNLHLLCLFVFGLACFWIRTFSFFLLLHLALAQLLAHALLQVIIAFDRLQGVQTVLRSCPRSPDPPHPAPESPAQANSDIVRYCFHHFCPTLQWLLMYRHFLIIQAFNIRFFIVFEWTLSAVARFVPFHMAKAVKLSRFYLNRSAHPVPSQSNLDCCYSPSVTTDLATPKILFFFKHFVHA